MPVPYYPQTTITPNLGLSLVGMDEVIARDMILIDAAVGSGGGAVTSVFGRVGVVVAQLGDYTVAQVTGAAPLASPPLTGVPTTPTAAPGTNTTQLASTAFVAAAVAAVVSPVASVFGRTGVVVAASNDYAITQISGLASGIATFLGTPTSANLATAVTDETGTGALVFAGSPALSGTPTAPTAAPGTNTTQLSTTAFVTAAVSAGGVVSSVFSRTGAVVAAANDYAITQISGLGTGIATFLGTPTSANMAAAVTDETGTGALLFANNPTMSGNGAASVSALLLNGTMFTSGGTGTTTIPYLLLQPSTATPVTTWATTGTVLGINAQSFVGNFIDFRVNGGVLGAGIQLSTTGKFTVPGSTNAGYFFSARGGYTMAGDGIATLFNNANTGFDRLQFGGQTTLFPALKRNLAAINVRLADDSADAPITASTATISAVAPTVSSGQVGLGATVASTVGAAGGASALPLTPSGYLIVNIAGTAMKIPYYAS